MTVYVDDHNAPYGRMKMSHMIADTSAELMAMADRIGMARWWLQEPGTHKEHFDIGLQKKRLAIAAGAVEVSQRELGRIVYARRPKKVEAHI